MRPKFRVWDNHYKRWEERLCAITNKGSLIIYNPDSGDWFEPQHTAYKVFWFTGLTDKNGKEIYEGDILRYPPKDDLELLSTDYFRQVDVVARQIDEVNQQLKKFE